MEGIFLLGKTGWCAEEVGRARSAVGFEPKQETSALRDAESINATTPKRMENYLIMSRKYVHACPTPGAVRIPNTNSAIT